MRLASVINTSRLLLACCSATKQAIADSGQLFGSQASAATRACGADGCGSIDNSILFVGGSINHAPLLSNAPSPPPCQPAGSDKASEAAAGSGCGSGSGSGIGSGSGSRSELQHSEQGVSTPLQMSSESDNPSLSGNDRERLKRWVFVSCVQSAGHGMC